MNLLISGGSGFVGMNLLSYIKEYPYEVNVIERNVLNDIVQLNKLFSLVNPGIVIHLAGKAHDFTKSNDFSEYYTVNYALTVALFDSFLNSDATTFIFISSVKAVADSANKPLNENEQPSPVSHYGISKKMAEDYILSKKLPASKRVFILRPCMIHGPGNKGNLNLLYNVVQRGVPWPLGGFENHRSYCSIENLCFVIKELIERKDIPSGIYNLADDLPLSTNEVIRLIAKSNDRIPRIIKINKIFINLLARIGDVLKLPLNTERLHKLTDNYIVSNEKISNALGKPLPVTSSQGLLKTFKSFSSND